VKISLKLVFPCGSLEVFTVYQGMEMVYRSVALYAKELAPVSVAPIS